MLMMCDGARLIKGGCMCEMFNAGQVTLNCREIVRVCVCFCVSVSVCVEGMVLLC